ncbi:GNAT family N-acetyltransferase [Streptomyces sp. YIM 98790]|uniref:GNAT family N-acetyltransferase n=1 Tax=Streptomyces sp. YIM 98790 TaxID=2689077 RepID=UPI00140BA6C9|nr:GNAT family N-acetyltransferase [Streptomyces sp. YIM 98790]
MEFTTGVRLEIRISGSDVGKRVSVRALARPRGAVGEGPLFTDTVGVLTSWTDGVLCVTRRDGVTVRIPESALAAGKVVPPVPARRRGMPSATVRELTRVAARGWPAPDSERLGGWLCRAARGWTRRANAAFPLGEPGELGSPGAVERVRAWYAERGLPAQLRVATGAAGTHERLAAGLGRHGWTAHAHTALLAGALAPLADREPDTRVRLEREPGEDWLRGWPRALQEPETARRVLAAGPSVWFAVVPAAAPGSGPAAVGRCVVDGRWAGFAAIAVAPERRREGLATAVMAELARAALAEGASAAWLEVETDNAPARDLYRGLGLAEHHHYHYLRAPQP